MTKARLPVLSAGPSFVILSVAFVIAIGAVLTAQAVGIEPIDAVAGPCMTFFALVASILALRCVLHRGFDRRTRQAWGWIAAGFIVLVAGFIAFAVTGDGSPRRPRRTPSLILL
jgi:hypothetical protein